MLIDLLLLQGVILLVDGEVVKSFNTCPTFFFKDQGGRIVPPSNLEGEQYKQICQRYCGDYRFATLYDTKNKIPVYSAYLYTGYKKLKRRNAWMIKPQVDIPGSSSDMVEQGSLAVGAKQALDSDYKHTTYQRGHLYPHCHNSNQTQANSTFTLTNAVPLDQTFNIKWYQNVEKVTANLIKECVLNSAHVVTGAVPGTNFIKSVNVPKFLWSAFYCKHKGQDGDRGWRGWAFMAPTQALRPRKHPHTKIKKHDSNHIKENWTLPISELNSRLEKYYGTPFKVFGDDCGQFSNF